MATNTLGQVKFVLGLIAMTGFAAIAPSAQSAPVPGAMSNLLSQANISLDASSSLQRSPMLERVPGLKKGSVMCDGGGSHNTGGCATSPIPQLEHRGIEKLPGLKKGSVMCDGGGSVNTGGCAASPIPGGSEVIYPVQQRLR
ncbi:MAG: hypothetical protein KME13_10710 [Myxacorys californica WJT36-NPBG1]|nr:hypothetical protein [Myxacorys californica WJT36-NPBG1]